MTNTYRFPSNCWWHKITKTKQSNKCDLCKTLWIQRSDSPRNFRGESDSLPLRKTICLLKRWDISNTRVRHSLTYTHSHTTGTSTSVTQSSLVSHPINADSFTSAGRSVFWKNPSLFPGSTTCLRHSTDRQTPCLPRCKGTTLHVRYECTQFTSRHLLLYSNLIPQHPVPLTSMSPNRSYQYPQHPRASPVTPFSPHLKDCPLYFRKLFCFSIFFCRSVTQTSGSSTFVQSGQN